MALHALQAMCCGPVPIIGTIWAALRACFEGRKGLRIDPALKAGDTERLRHVRERLFPGRALRVATVGGSSTAGHSFARDAPGLFHSRLMEWLKCAFPANHTHVNSGTPATGPQYMEKCLSY